MLSQEEVEVIKKKIQTNYLNYSILAKKLGCSRQTISLLLKQKMTSQEIEYKLLNWALKNKDFGGRN